MKAAYPTSLFDSPSNGATFVMEVDDMTGNWIIPPEYPRYCGYSAQVGMDILSPATWKRERQTSKAGEGKSLHERSKSSQQSAPVVSTSSRQAPSSAVASSSIMEDPTHGIPPDTNYRCSNFSRNGGEGIKISSGSGDTEFQGRRQRKATIQAPLPGDDRTTGANIPEKIDVCESPERQDAKSNCSFADLYVSPKDINPADYKNSTLFSTSEIASSPEEVIFPKRKNRADRNAWRDWTNSGYADWVDDHNIDSTDPTGNSNVIPRDSYVDTNVQVSAVHRRLPEDYSVERISVPNTEQSSACRPEDSLSSGCDPRDTPESCSGDVSYSNDPPQAESKAMKEVDFSTVNGGAGRSVTRKEQLARCDSQKMSPRLRGVRCKQRSFNQNCTAGNFPPPLESLSKHKSQRPANQIPWVQLHHVRSQGKFMLEEVEVTQPVVFQPIRKDGRLELHLVDQSDDVEDGELVTSDDKQLTLPAEAIITIAAAPPHVVGNRTDVVSKHVAESEGRKVNVGAESWRVDDSETHQLPENLSLPRKEKWRRSMKIWPEVRRSVPSSAMEAEWMGQKIDETSFASSVRILDRKRNGLFHSYDQDRAPEAKPSLAVYESIIRDSFLSFTTAHSFLRSLSGNADANLSDYASKPLGGGKTFLCGGIGKSSHGNAFCQRSPCVS